MRLFAVLGLCALITSGCSSSSSTDEAPGDRDDGAATPPSTGSSGRDGVQNSEGASPTRPPPAPLPPATITWKPCNGVFECGTMTVPRDYSDPAAGSLQLALLRKRARGERIGSLLMNPGGPGGSAIEFMAAFSQSEFALGQRFDLVAFDPRGVGQSSPIDCHDTLQQYIAADPSPDDESEWKAIDDVSKRFAGDCAAKYAELLPHLGTPNVARDMDRVREGLGEAQISYLGYSYGTAIGAWYAALFPKQVRAMVLDGAVDLSLSAVELSLEQARGFDDALGNYFEWCKGVFRCTWASGDTPEATFARLAAQVDRAPLRSRGADRPAGHGEFTLGVLATLYGGESGWQALSAALAAAMAGDGTNLVRLTDMYLGRATDGSYPNQIETNNAVNCLDKPTPDVATLRADTARFEREAPLFGTSVLTGLFVCAHWPAKSSETTLPPPAGAPPIVVIGTTGDPATPYAWAGALAEQVGTGVLLTYQAEGHTAYGRGTACVDNTVNAYFIDGEVPAEGMRCRDPLRSELPAPALFRFAPGGR